MIYSIRFTPEAENTFDALSAQLMRRWGTRYVKMFEERVSKALSVISKTLYLYPIVIERAQVRKCILHKNCSLFYKVSNDVVIIICFWDNRQEPLFSI